MRRRGPESDVPQSEELERLCAELGRFEAPFDEITRSRAEARLAAELAREPERRHRRRLVGLERRLQAALNRRDAAAGELDRRVMLNTGSEDEK